jgi:hypothetical protein
MNVLSQVNGTLARRVAIVTKGDSAPIRLEREQRGTERNNEQTSGNDWSTESARHYPRAGKINCEGRSKGIPRPTSTEANLLALGFIHLRLRGVPLFDHWATVVVRDDFDGC